MIDEQILFEDPEFNKQFWRWFDSLPSDKRKQFYYYKHDFAKLNFYNTQYNRGNVQ